jgi:hypothetical protein
MLRVAEESDVSGGTVARDSSARKRIEADRRGQARISVGLGDDDGLMELYRSSAA